MQQLCSHRRHAGAASPVAQIINLIQYKAGVDQVAFRFQGLDNLLRRLARPGHFHRIQRHHAQPYRKVAAVHHVDISALLGSLTRIVVARGEFFSDAQVNYGVAILFHPAEEFLVLVHVHRCCFAGFPVFHRVDDVLGRYVHAIMKSVLAQHYRQRSKGDSVACP